MLYFCTGRRDTSITLLIEVNEVFEKGFGKEDAKKGLGSFEEAARKNSLCSKSLKFTLARNCQFIKSR